MKEILFLCSGNYYRSRFAEILFNHLVQATDADWSAESRGIVAQWSHNPGPISQATLHGLAARGILHRTARYPIQLKESDLFRAERVIALYELEHRPMLDEYFPAWTERVTYWQVPDLGEMDADAALALIEENVRLLLQTINTLPPR